MDNTKQFTAIEWCAGYGGIHLGLKRAIPNLRVIAYGEIEGFACANLVSKMEAGLMDCAPIWSDLKTFPCEEFRDRVDLLVAGYPCQPFSAAGKRGGKDDPRHLWPWIADGIRILRPRMCFFENVEGHISLGLSSVISDLEELGYQVSWGIFSAREVDAPHQRKRVFILAYDSSKGLEGLRQCCDTQGWSAPIGYARSCGNSWPSRPGEPQHNWEPPRVVGNATQLFGDGGHNHSGVSERPEEISQSGDSSWQAMGNAESTDCQKRSKHHRGESAATSNTQQIQSGGGDCGSLRDSNRKAQSSLGRDSHGSSDWMDDAELYTTCDNRTDELRLLGNGVVPATAERAFRTLLEELYEES